MNANQPLETIPQSIFNELVTNQENRTQLAEELLNNRVPEQLRSLAESLLPDESKEEITPNTPNEKSDYPDAGSHMDALLTASLQTKRPLSLRMAIWYVANESGFLSDTHQSFDDPTKFTEYLIGMINPMCNRAGGNLSSEDITPEIQQKRNAADTIYATALKYTLLTGAHFPDQTLGPFSSNVTI